MPRPFGFLHFCMHYDFKEMAQPRAMPMWLRLTCGKGKTSMFLFSHCTIGLLLSCHLSFDLVACLLYHLSIFSFIFLWACNLLSLLWWLSMQKGAVDLLCTLMTFFPSSVHCYYDNVRYIFCRLFEVCINGLSFL